MANYVHENSNDASINKSDAENLKKLEKILGCSIPQIKQFATRTFGYIVRENKIVELRARLKKTSKLPLDDLVYMNTAPWKSKEAWLQGFSTSMLISMQKEIERILETR